MAVTRVTDQRAVAVASTPLVAATVPRNDVVLTVTNDQVVARPLLDSVIAQTTQTSVAARVEGDPVVRVTVAPQEVVVRQPLVGPQGPQGAAGDQGIFFGPDEPVAETPPWLWIETEPDGTLKTFWVRTL